ncbi:hypothetical protein F2Q68_00021026 [Brassica cretica]|uniref:Retrotransposon gag domain-containing protein n=1 Tax=Brassica cretica TaxID=69181 RepID=A0A8S9G2A8_BRACR|nr:hypothetical protein F2Q68_00021026 [Brassica cretica]
MKYFPKEAMDRKKYEFEHVSQGEMSIREYEVVFNQLHRFAGVGISEEDLIRKFLSGMRVEIRNRCRVVTYHKLGDLVEKATEQEAGLAEEQKLAKAAHVKSGKAPESNSRGGDQSGLLTCPRCCRRHSGKCPRCFICGQLGLISKYCQRLSEEGHCGTPPPLKRLAIAPRVFAVGDPQGAEPIAGSVSVLGESAHTLFDTGASHSFHQQWHKFALAIISKVTSSEIVRGGALRHSTTTEASSHRSTAAVPGHRTPRLLSTVAAVDLPVSPYGPPPSPPVTDTGDSPVTQSTHQGKPVSLVKSISGQGLTGLTFDQRVDFQQTLTKTYFCMPDCMRGYGHSVNRLDRSLVWSIKRLRAVTPSTLSEVFVWPVSGQRVCASLGSLLVAWVL